VKIATWNVNSLRVRLPHVLAWVAEHQPDILALQEIKTTEDNFPFAEIEAAGYSVVASGQKSYNGVAILSRENANDIIKTFPDFNDDQRRVLAITIGNLRILNLYVPNGEHVTSAKYQYKLNWLNNLHQFIQNELKKYPQMIVLGDFNIAPHEIDLYDPQIFFNQVLFSEPERQAFHGLVNLGLQDCLRAHTQEQLFTWWDYRLNAFQRNLGVRIDHILASNAAQCLSCYVDKTPRSWERPSDHAPVIAEFAIA
jgi:exodeoxyribonuclease III